MICCNGVIVRTSAPKAVIVSTPSDEHGENVHMGGCFLRVCDVSRIWLLQFAVFLAANNILSAYQVLTQQFYWI